jgi:hypothetical protein
VCTEVFVMSESVPIDRRVWRKVARLVTERYENPRRRKSIEKIARRYLSGETCAAIAEDVGLTAERVRQILRHLGISRLQGGVSLRTRRRLRAELADKERRSERHAQRYYRCTREEVEDVIREWRAMSAAHRRLPHWAPRSPLHRFRVFCASLGRTRGRPVTITLPEWWAMWKDSGHWSTYGRGRNSHRMRVRRPDRPVDARNLEIVASSEALVAPRLRSSSGRRRTTAPRASKAKVRTSSTARARLKTRRSRSR